MMAKYRKKPVVIEAFKLGVDYIPDWFMDAVTANEVVLHGASSGFCHVADTNADIHTLEGWMHANYGDYIIRGVNGEIYPCEADIFEKTYEAVTMSDGEKLVERLREMASRTPPVCQYDHPKEVEVLGKQITVYCKPFEQFQDLMSEAADAIVNGVTVRKSSCPYCCDDGEGAHGRLKHSYDDEDGMAMSVHPSPKRKDGTRSLAWWATVHFRGECRDFYIEVCPFCGRRLVPLREEYDCSPEPPKECE